MQTQGMTCGHSAAARLAAAALALATLAPAYAVNKCTTAAGAVVYQDAPCDAAAKSAQSVKTWDNTPGNYAAAAAPRQIVPDAKLSGPPQAAQLLGIYRRWIDAERLALATARIALSGPLATMQALNREAEAAGAAACLQDAKRALTDITGRSVEAMLAFMGNRHDIQGMVYQLVDRGRLITAFEQGISQARCA